MSAQYLSLSVTIINLSETDRKVGFWKVFGFLKSFLLNVLKSIHWEEGILILRNGGDVAGVRSVSLKLSISSSIALVFLDNI